MNKTASAATLVSAFTCVLAAGCTQSHNTAPETAPLAPPVSTSPPATPAPRPQIGAFGLDLAAGDSTVAAGDNFYLHASSTWLKANPIPPDRTRWGTFDLLRTEADTHVRELVDELGTRGTALSPVEAKVRDYYRAYMNEGAIEAAGLTPIKQDLARIAGAANHTELMRIVAEPGFEARRPIVAGIGLDAKSVRGQSNQPRGKARCVRNGHRATRCSDPEVTVG